VPLKVFLSHAWVDQSAARVQENSRRGLAPLLRDKLTDQGVNVFYDECDIEELDDIEHRIRSGVAASTLFLCWYSNTYRDRRACNWELTAALATDPSRVVVVNPETDLDHVLPTSLRASLIASARDAEDTSGWEYLTRRIIERGLALGGVFGGIATAETTPWFGDPPTRFSRFVGRAEPLWQLDSLLRPPPAVSGGGPAPSAVVVHGLGGIGKTALACEYATRFAGAYPGGIYWLRLGSPAPGVEPSDHVHLRLASQLVRIADQLQPDAPLDAGAALHSPEAVARVVGRHLEHLEEPYLWVVDDLPVGLSATDFASCLPPGRNGRSLVTTQGTTYRHVPNLPISVMPPREAVEFLLDSRADRDESELVSAEELAARLGHLPLALEVVGTLASLPGTSLESLLAELTQSAEALDLVEEAAKNPLVPVSATEHTLSAAMTFGPSINRLDEPSFWLLATASALNVAPLPVRVIWPAAQSTATASLRRRPREWWRGHRRMSAGMPSASLRPSLGTLLSRSLVREVDADTIEVHGLVADAVLHYLKDRARFVTACVADAGGHIVDELGDVNDIRTHRTSQRIATFGQALAEHSQDLGDHAMDVEALRRLGRFFHVEQRYHDAADIQRRLVSEVALTLGEQARATLGAQCDLAVSLAHSGRSQEAIDLLQRVAETLERCFGPEDIDTLTAKHNLTNQLKAADPAARKLALEVYETRLRVLGPDHEHTLFSLHSLLADNIVPAQYHDQIAAYQDLIARRTRLQGEDHTTTLTSMSNFVALLSRRDPESALPWARKLLQRRTVLYGPDHAATMTARSRLLQTLVALPEPPVEEIRVLVEDIQRYASTPPEGATTGQFIGGLSDAGNVLRQAGHAELAVAVLRAAQRISEAVFDPREVTALLVEHNLAAAVAAQGKPAEAKALFDELIPAMQSALGAEHRLTLRARRQQALLLAKLGSPAAALERQLALAATWQAQCGEASPEYAEALGDIATTYELLARPEDALRYRALQQQTGAADDIDAAGHV
jgi:tetratricopeptide (TPR) repeat protein